MSDEHEPEAGSRPPAERPLPADPPRGDPRRDDPRPADPPTDDSRPEDPRIAEIVAAIRARTPARLLLGRRGGSYRTRDRLALEADHAAAVDAVWRDLDPHRDWPAGFLEEWGFACVASAAATREEHIRRPDRGRILAADAVAVLREACPAGAELQVIVGDGLSAAAVAEQVPRLLPLVAAAALARGWTLGRPILVRHCRVGIMNAIGGILGPRVAVLLVGERPGLRFADSLSAYLAWRPAEHHTDADRNLVATIHAAGTPPDRAAERIIALVAEMMRLGTSGPVIKEVLPAVLPPPTTTARGLPDRPPVNPAP